MKRSLSWRAALKEEVDSVIPTGTIILSTLPTVRKVIPKNFIFKRKLGVDVDLKRYKARLVVHGNLQHPGVDYDETYALFVDC